MKIDIKKVPEGEDELILRYKELTPVVKRILDAVNADDHRLIGRIDDRRIVIDAEEILYFETVDDKSFAYTASEVIRLDDSLQGILETLDDIRFFRCSKSMIININKVRVLKSMSSNRIDATLENGEHIMISRTYASDFRKILKGGMLRGR